VGCAVALNGALYVKEYFIDSPHVFLHIILYFAIMFIGLIFAVLGVLSLFLFLILSAERVAVRGVLLILGSISFFAARIILIHKHCPTCLPFPSG
jgi:hypothetical protein